MTTTDKVKSLMQENTVFFLFCTALSITFLNVSLILGIILFVLLIALAIGPPLLAKQEETINYWYFIIDKATKLELKLEEQAKEREAQNARAEEERQRQSEENIRLAEQEEAITLEIKAKEKAERRKLFDEEMERELTSTQEMLIDRGLSEGAIAIALDEKRDKLLQSFEQAEYQSTKSDSIITSTFEQSTQSSQQSSPKKEVAEFELQKHGQMINYVIIFVGFLSIFLLMNILQSIFELPMSLTGSFGVFLGVVFVINLIHYLPTLLYHASISGKLFVFVLNFIFGFTIIGWILLLIYVQSKNKQHAYREELLHLKRNKQ